MARPTKLKQSILDAHSASVSHKPGYPKTFTLRKIHEDLHTKWKIAAIRAQTSVNDLALTILEQVLGAEPIHAKAHADVQLAELEAERMREEREKKIAERAGADAEQSALQQSAAEAAEAAEAAQPQQKEENV